MADQILVICVTCYAPICRHKCDRIKITLEVHGAGLVADGFEQAGQTKVSRAPKETVGGADEEFQCVFGEDIERARDLDKERKSPAGRKPFDAVLMFKVLILQSLYGLSDDMTEYQILDRLSLTKRGETPTAWEDHPAKGRKGVRYLYFCNRPPLWRQLGDRLT